MNITEEQEQFIKGLDKKLSQSTLYNYRKAVELLLEWMQAEKKKLKTVQYNDLLEFVRHLKKQGKDNHRTERIIMIVKQYFSVKVKQKHIKKNPATGLKIKTTSRRLPHNLLDRKSLDELYEHYPSATPTDKRNKVMLGLLVFQALTSGDLQRLKTEHVKLKEGKIYIPSSTGTALRNQINRRTLELKASQLLDMKEYMENVRPQFLKRGNTEKLFLSEQGNTQIDNSIFLLSQKLQQLDNRYRNPTQLRASVIAEWLKEKDLRIVQYMAGHRKVESTEFYRAVRTEDIQQALEKFHPMK